jgi:phosphoglycolate phosphatase
MHKLELAVLDMAGTTVNENGCVERAFLAAIDYVGAPPPDAGVLHAMRGRSKREVFQHLVAVPERAAVAHDEFVRYLLNAAASGVLVPCPGAEETLRALRDDGARVCLITGFDTEVRQAVIDCLGWASLVDLTLSPDNDLRGRPFPDLIFQAMVRLKATGVQSVLVAGDTTNDLLSGYRAGAGLNVGVLGGAHGRDELERAPHTHLADGIGQLLNVIRVADGPG